MEYKLFIGGQWLDGGPVRDVLNKYNGDIVGRVVTAREKDVDRAVAAAKKAAPVIADLPAYKRAEILLRTAKGIEKRSEEIARVIAMEAGKTLKYARIEAERAVSLFQIAAEEAKRIHGETVPLDAVAPGEGYFGFWHRRPVGVVAAITPFNFPLNMAVHKVAPAIAAANSVILKPASSTPLSACILCEILHEAGLPDGGINLINGSGKKVGNCLITDPRVAKITFTGSREVGQHILSVAGIKKVTLELGNNSPVIVAPDADIDFMAKRCAVGAFYNSGQVCISVQRIYSAKNIFENVVNNFSKEAQAMKVGDPLDETTDVGPMIDLKEAERIENWVSEAKSCGANIVTGGRREGAVYFPTVLTDVKPDMKVVAQETFAPVASIMPYENFEQAIEMANNSQYGLQVAVFTKDIERVLYAVKKLDFGGIIINDTANFRADHMPYGGNRQSGLGREGVKYAIEDMTNIQMVVIKEK